MKNRVVFHVTIMMLIAIPMSFLFYGWISLNYDSSPRYEYTEVTRTEPRVYVTKTGSSYHSNSCGALYKSKIAMGRGEAQEKGYLACQRCGGVPNGTITVTYTVKKQIPMGSREVVGSILLSIVATPLLYLFSYSLITEWKENAWLIKGNALKKESSNNMTAKKQEANEQEPNSPIGRNVTHKRFGKGVVTEIIDNNQIEVYFMGIDCHKKFLFPEAFENDFIAFCDSEEEYI